MDTNNETKTINEEELEAVSGGVGDGEQCFFHPKSSTLGSKHGADPSYIWLQCAYMGASCRGCACHGRDHCVDCWHKVDKSTDGLLPNGFANHGLKSFTKDYTTPQLP